VQTTKKGRGSGVPRAADRPDKSWMILFLCWLLVMGTTLGSLFFSEKEILAR